MPAAELLSPSDTLEDASPEAIAGLSNELVVIMTRATKEIYSINDRMRLLSFNAQIEAARAGGTTGAAFGVVAAAIRTLSDKTSGISTKLSDQTAEANDSLQRIIKTLATNVRGTRLSDLALCNIDLIDRNLYERSCDVRWWATDSSVVQALQEAGSAAYQFASLRLGQILDSYTVYYDLVLCDLQGKVVANGRPRENSSQGMDCTQSAWFQTALATRSGDEFGFETVHASPLVGGRKILAYSCVVREGGSPQGKPLGVLGILFNWDALAQTIVENTPLTAEEKARTRVCIAAADGTVLADSHRRTSTQSLQLPGQAALFAQAKNFALSTYEGRECCIGHAKSPGYETYATGWHSLLIQTEPVTG